MMTLHDAGEDARCRGRLFFLDDAAALCGYSWRRSNWERLVGWIKDGEKEQAWAEGGCEGQGWKDKNRKPRLAYQVHCQGLRAG